jgi:hypothetical protein
MGMRVALLIPGEPRFCKEFDQFLQNLQGYHQVDWFVWLWQNSQCEEHRGVDVVAPSWRQLDHSTTWARIQQHLPVQHQLINLTIARKELYPSPQVGNKAGETSVERMWGMYTSLRECDLARRAHEQSLGQRYDLVIRTRADLGLASPLDLKNCLEYLEQNPQTIMTPHNDIHGYGHRTNDMMALGLSEAMTTYCDLAQHLLTYHHNMGILYHPETMLAFHMAHQGIANHNKDSYQVILRRFGTVEQGAYRSDYGRWA